MAPDSVRVTVEDISSVTIIPEQNSGSGIGMIGYITPESCGAVGDGVYDDAPALQRALASGKPVCLTQDLHLFSHISVTDKDVYLEGLGHTLYLHGLNMAGNTASGGSGGVCVNIGSTWNDGVIQNADVIIYTEDGTANVEPAFPNQCSYHRGYLSYHGRNPTPTKETYEDYTTHSWKEVRADIRNVNFVGDHTDGLTYLRLNLVCNSKVDNCMFKCVTVDGAAIGLQVNYGYNVMLSRIRAENFTCNTARLILSTGYGIQAIGDAITISNCILSNCKNHINIGGGSGPSGIFTTGAIMDNIVMYTKDTGEKSIGNPDANLYQQMLDLHEGCHHPLVSNIYLEYENAKGESGWGTLIHLSCPSATVSNVVCRYHDPYGEYGLGYIGFGPLAERFELNNIHAPGCMLFAHGWGYEREVAYDANKTKEIIINGGEIGGIMSRADTKNSLGLVKIRLNGVKVSGTVWCSTLIADSCVFKNEFYYGDDAEIRLDVEGVFTNCDISYNIHNGYKRSKSLVLAPENSVMFANCILRKPQDAVLFKNTQTQLVNTVVYDIYGLILGSRTSAIYSDGEECYLGSFNLW